MSVFRSISLLILCCALTLSMGVASAQDQTTKPPYILIFGDSLSAAYGMSLEESWPRLLENRLQDKGHRYRIINSSITGDTTQGGLSRMPRLLDKYKPDWVIIELGGNDGLRGLSLDVTRSNLTSMVQKSQQAGANVLLTGIMLPPNYGQSYTEQFHAMYGEIATEFGTLLVPFFMEGVALVEGMMQADGIHPSAAAQPRLLDNVWQVLESELNSVISAGTDPVTSLPD